MESASFKHIYIVTIFSTLLMLNMSCASTMTSDETYQSEKTPENIVREIDSETITSLQSDHEQKELTKQKDESGDASVSCVDAYYVNDVVSANKIHVTCGDKQFKVEYVGVSIDGLDEENRYKARDLNEFLVLNKYVELDTTSVVRNENHIILIAEAFIMGESVNVRLIESGLVAVGSLPKSFSRENVFIKAAKESENRTIGNWEGIKNQEQIKMDKKEEKIEWGGCGTLPCQNKK